MTYCAAVDARVNPRLAPGLDALRWHLLDHHYSDVAAFDICHHVLEEGTLAGAPGLEREDEALAEEAFVRSLPAVPFDSPEWTADQKAWDEASDAGFEAAWQAFELADVIAGDDDRTEPDDFDAAMAELEDSDPVPAEFPESYRAPDGWAAIEPDDRPSQARPDRTTGLLSAIALIGVAMACGGSLVHEMAHEHHRPSYQEPTFAPSADDWEEYRQWSESLDAHRSWDDQTAEWNDARESGASWACI
jgi:hypothetical protein